MLNFKQKIEIFKSYLEEENGSYGDEMKNEIQFFFENDRDFKFLADLNTKEDIENKIEQVVSRMILHEHEDELKNIISYQLYG
jgi:hypothetical protein